MSKTSKCSKCGNKKWKRKSEDSFICVKCRQAERGAERGEGMAWEETKGILAQIKYEHTSNFGTKDSTAKACDTAIRSLEAWKSVIEEINEVDFYFLINASGSCAEEVIKNALLNTIKKALKEVEE